MRAAAVLEPRRRILISLMRIVEDRWAPDDQSLFTWDKTIIGMGYWGRFAV
jgi:hypothetical protein